MGSNTQDEGAGIALAEALVKQHEGWVPNMYLDTLGVPTLGWGFNLRYINLTQDEGQLILARHLREAIDFLRTKPWWSALTTNRKACLIDMAYDLGPARFDAFRIMNACLERGDWDGAAAAMLDSEWAAEVKLRAIDDARLMREG